LLADKNKEAADCAYRHPFNNSTQSVNAGLLMLLYVNHLHNYYIIGRRFGVFDLQQISSIAFVVALVVAVVVVVVVI
jgi:uncharacterized membrane protein